MNKETADAPVTEQSWEVLEAGLSHGTVPPMRVLFATDASEPAQAAEAFLALLPLPAGSAVQTLTVLDAPAWQVPESLKGAEREWGQQIGHAVEARLARPGVRFTHGTPRGEPALEILREAETFGAELIVVGSHGRTGLQRFLLGSVAENVSKHAAHPVLVARAPAGGLRSIVLALDGSEHAGRALRMAGHLPLPAETRIRVCHVVRPYYPVVGPEYTPDLDQILAEERDQRRRNGERLVASAARTLEQWGKHVDTVIREGDPAAEILALVKEQEADLVIAGARGGSSIQALLVGSVADRLLKHAECSILLIH